MVAEDLIERYDPGNAAVIADPYPYYSALLSLGGPVKSQNLDATLISSFSDAQEALRSEKLAVHSHQTRDKGRAGSILLFMDPPEHTRLRTQLARVFNPKRIASLRSVIEQTVDEVLDQALDLRRMDVIGQIAYPLPVAVISELLGIPPEDRAHFGAEIRNLTVIFDWQPNQSALQRSAEAILTLMPYFRRLVKQRLDDPGDDLISELIAIQASEGGINKREIMATCILLYAAGFLTTASLIGNGVLCLIRNPSECSKLRNDSSLVGSAIEEMLRYESPAQVAPRIARGPMQWGDVKVVEGDNVLVLIGAANRDSKRFTDPNMFSVSRAENTRHLTFGHGIHFCLGAPLARLEGQVFLDRLLARTKEIDLLSEEIEWRPSKTQRVLDRLDVAVA
ncbi:MAG: cytochrome P450 [Acidimicrobiales bacterium]